MPLLNSATTSIDVLQFNFFSESGHVLGLANELIGLKAAHPQLRIRVALEVEKDADKPKGAATRNKLTQALLEKGGIEVHWSDYDLILKKSVRDNNPDYAKGYRYKDLNGVWVKT